MTRIQVRPAKFLLKVLTYAVTLTMMVISGDFCSLFERFVSDAKTFVLKNL